MIPEPMLAKLEELAKKTCAFYWSDVHEPEEHKAAFETAMGMAKEAWELATNAERDRCAHSAYLMRYDLNTGETWDEALRRHKERILNPKAPNHD